MLLESRCVAEKEVRGGEEGKLKFAEGSECLAGSRCYKKRRTFPLTSGKVTGKVFTGVFLFHASRQARDTASTFSLLQEERSNAFALPRNG